MRPRPGGQREGGHRDDARALRRCAALLRLAEQLERSHDQAVEAAEVFVRNGAVDLHLRAREDISVARWSAQRERDLFERAFGRPLNLVGP